MKKADLIELVKEQGGYETKREAERALDAVIGAFTSALSKGESVELIGFGKFSVVERPAREARVPSTGKIIQVPASKGINFKAGKKLKEAVNS